MNDFYTFEYEIYFGGVAGQTPPYPVDYDELEAAAREKLDRGPYGYVAGSAATGDTERRNREAFGRWRIVPRMMRDIGERDLGLELLGLQLGAPVICAPVGVQEIVHDEAELAVARAASSLGVPFALSSVSSYPMEQVAEAAGDGARWFQLYWPADRDLTLSLIRRAEEAGYTAVVITLDTKLLAWRPMDLTGAYLPFLEGKGQANYRTDEVFRSGLNPDIEDENQAALLRWAEVWSDAGITWSDLEWLRSQTELPLILKGILHPDDAVEGIELGVDAILVSNHGGRQVDGAIASLEALPTVVEAVGGRVPVLMDSGIRSGADIFKALCLGASAVLIGRPYVWGLALGGEEGVRHVLRWLLADLELTMALSGYRRLDELSPDALVRV